jgi:uncharacterized protein (TIGR00369 family)
VALVAAREYPETRMRVGAMTMGDGLRVPMRVGPWMDGPDGGQLTAALGVLVDDAVGVEVHRHRPEGTHSVTTELSLDVVVAPPWAGPELLATARLVGTGPHDGVSRAEIRAGDGQVVAVASGRSRFVPATGLHAGAPELERQPPQPLEPAAHRTILEVFGIADLAGALTLDPDLAGVPQIARLHAAAPIPAPRTGADDGLASLACLVVPPAEAFGNASGTMHGGLQFAAVDLAAAALAGALRPAPARDHTSSVRMNLLRPALLTDPVTFTASVLSRGRSLSVYRVTAHGAAGKPYTVATVTRASRA